MKYIIVVDKQPRSNPSAEKRETIIDIEELRRKGNVHDDFVIEKGIAKVYRRIGLTKYHVTYILENEVIEELGELKIKLFKGDNYLYVKDEYNNNMCAEFVIDNEFNDRYVTYLKMESAIEETANMIKLFVGQALEGYSDTKETQAMIKLAADGIIDAVDEKFKNYDTTEEAHSKIEQKANEVSTTVEESVTAALLTLLNNDYLTAEQVNAAVNGNTEAIATVKEQLKQTVTSSQMQIEISKAIERWSKLFKKYAFHNR